MIDIQPSHIILTPIRRVLAFCHHTDTYTTSPSILSKANRQLVSFLERFEIVLGFNDTSTLVGHFVSSPREREKRDRRDSRRDEKEGQGRKRNGSESEEMEEIKTFPLYPYLLQGQQSLPTCKPISVGFLERTDGD